MWLMFRAYGRKTSYLQMHGRLPAGRAPSLLELQRVASQAGLETAVRALAPGELSESLPAIVVYQASPGLGGEVLLVYAVNDESVDCITGAFAEHRRMPLDEFRRNWTGHALLVTARAHSHRLLLAVASLGTGRFDRDPHAIATAPIQKHAAKPYSS